MATYKVIAKGFYNGALYTPDGKRNTLTVDKAFTKKNMPSWVQPIKEPTAAEKKAAEKAAKEAAEAQAAADAENQKDIDEVTFLDKSDDNAPAETVVETL